MSAAPSHAARRSPVAGDVDGPPRSLLAGVLMGIGVAGFIDETVFHQLLHWHHFYDKSTPSWGLVSDGLFHAASWFCMIAGLFVFADLRRRGRVAADVAGSRVLLRTRRLSALRRHDPAQVVAPASIRYHVAILPCLQSGKPERFDV